MKEMISVHICDFCETKNVEAIFLFVFVANLDKNVGVLYVLNGFFEAW